MANQSPKGLLNLTTQLPKSLLDVSWEKPAEVEPFTNSLPPWLVISQFCCGPQIKFRTITTDDKPIQRVLKATIVGSNLRSETQISRPEVNSVITCNCHISFCQISPGRITAALASQAPASTML